MAESMQAETEDVEVQLDEATTEEAQTNAEVVVEEPEQTTPEPEEAKSDEQEIANYSESVKKRINKLTYKIREAERREAAAVEYAKGVQEKLNSTQATLSQKDKNLYDEYSARVESQLATAEGRYKKAHDLGDSEEMLAAQKDVATLAVELESLNRVRPQAEAQEQPVDIQPQQAVQQPQVQAPPQPDAKAQEWAAKND